MKNMGEKTIASFYGKLLRFDKSYMTQTEANKAFHEYFSVLPWSDIPVSAEGFDMGCGGGRWARFVSSRVGRLNSIDPSATIDLARRMLSVHDNFVVFQASVDSSGLAPCSQDFGYTLGVLHHAHRRPGQIGHAVRAAFYS
jgi:hypothetical protein